MMTVGRKVVTRSTGISHHSDLPFSTCKPMKPRYCKVLDHHRFSRPVRAQSFSTDPSSQSKRSDHKTAIWNDLINWKSSLSTEEKEIHDAALSFCNSHLQSNIVSAARNETFDKNIMKEFGKQGFLGPTIQGYGCLGASNIIYGLIANAVESIDSGYRSAMSVQSSLVMGPIYKFGSTEQRNKYLPSLASGDMIGCFGLTEPNHGSDPSGK